MTTILRKLEWALLTAGLFMTACLLLSVGTLRAQDDGKKPSSYAPVDIHETFSTIMTRMVAAKPEIMRRHLALLEQRYDLSNRPAQGVRMSGGKAVQQGVRVKLAAGTTWDQLSKLTLTRSGAQPLPRRL